MAKSSSTAVRPKADRPTLYQEITDKIIAELEGGCVPWVQPWGRAGGTAAVGLPRNASTGRAYSGVNILILWGAVIERSYRSQAWLTFNQARELGGMVRRGERGTTVVYAGRFTPEQERERAARDGDAPGAVPFLKRFTLFNVEQCDGLPPDLGVTPPPPENLILPHAEALIRATGADLRIGSARAYYDVGRDLIQVPPPQAYHHPIDWHRTAFHEVGHWSGAAHRLGRDLTGRMGSSKYAKEELVAEMTAAFVCASLGIVPTVRHADYLGSWLEVLREDNRAIVRAASAASKAAEFILAFAPADEPGTGQGQGRAPTDLASSPADALTWPEVA